MENVKRRQVEMLYRPVLVLWLLLLHAAATLARQRAFCFCGMMSQLKNKQPKHHPEQRRSHLENETAVDDQQSNENDQIFSKGDKKVSFKWTRLNGVLKL